MKYIWKFFTGDALFLGIKTLIISASNYGIFGLAILAIIGISLLPATLLISNIVGVISIRILDLEVEEIRDNEKQLWANKEGIYTSNPELDWTIEADKKEKEFRDTNKI